MSMSFTASESITFTVTHARHIAAKVATDLKRIQRLYGAPSDERIAQFEAEVTALLKAGYLGTVTYGFKRSDKWIEPTLRYTAKDLAEWPANDDDPGRIRPGANIVGALFSSYLTYSASWNALSAEGRLTFEQTLPFQRNGAMEPSVNGYLASDLNYSAGGKVLSRSTVRSF